MAVRPGDARARANGLTPLERARTGLMYGEGSVAER
jgi:hypothetical protein